MHRLRDDAHTGGLQARLELPQGADLLGVKAAAAVPAPGQRFGEPAWGFFEQVIAGAGNWFDLFSVHLYDEPARTPAQIQAVAR